MLRSQQRQLREYLNKAKFSKEDGAYQQDKKRLKLALDENKAIPQDLRNRVDIRNGLDLENVDSLDDKRDDEYRFAGSYEPKILITTSSSPSAPTVRFAKELKLVIPNSQRINRGQTTENDLANLCRQDDITDLIEISGADGQGRPTMMRICHFPFGPTAQFTISDVTMRADLPEKPPHMSQANPNLIFHKFESKVGKRFQSILKYIFPIATSKSRRVLSFINDRDRIIVRHHVWESSSTLRKFRQKDPSLDEMNQDSKDRLMERLNLFEAGPRFTLLPYRIVRGTLGQKDDQVEWVKSNFIRKAASVLADR